MIVFVGGKAELRRRLLATARIGSAVAGIVVDEPGVVRSAAASTVAAAEQQNAATRQFAHAGSVVLKYRRAACHADIGLPGRDRSTEIGYVGGIAPQDYRRSIRSLTATTPPRRGQRFSRVPCQHKNGAALPAIQPSRGVHRIGIARREHEVDLSCEIVLNVAD